MKYAVLLATLLLSGQAMAAEDAHADAAMSDSSKASDTYTRPQRAVSSGAVTVEGRKLNYTADAGTLILKNAKGEPAAQPASR